MTDEQSTGDYRCYGRCGRKFDELEEMIAVAGRGNRSPRHFCAGCARSLPHSPEEAYQ
jgi:hypothetical protein